MDAARLQADTMRIERIEHVEHVAHIDAGRAAAAPATADVVFLLDVDNTLLDNDRIVVDLHAHLDAAFGATTAALYWRHFEALRGELGYADYLGALQRWRGDVDDRCAGADQLLSVSNFLLDYPFAERLYPHALGVVARLGGFGPTVILSDGDVVFQPRKVLRSGLWQAVAGRVLIYVHKEAMLASVQRLHPARRYVLVDDKPRILAAIKAVLGDRVVTVFPRQGHYANDPASDPLVDPARHAGNSDRAFAADCTVDHIGDLMTVDIGALLAATPTKASA